jgi:hypothetical protein
MMLAIGRQLCCVEPSGGCFLKRREHSEKARSGRREVSVTSACISSAYSASAFQKAAAKMLSTSIPTPEEACLRAMIASGYATARK